MTDTFVCGECELVHGSGALKITQFRFPAQSRKGLEVITVDVNLCTTCFINGGLSERQQKRIKSRIVDKLKAAANQDQ